jgi:tetratricopeptide (TPR) repeat protein
METRPLIALLFLLVFTTPIGAVAQVTTTTDHSGITLHMAGPGAQAPAPMAQPSNPGTESSALAAADQLFVAGKIQEAIVRYQAVANANPGAVQAQVGLIRCYLMLQKLDDAQRAATTALAVKPDSPLLLTTVGDLQFRQGKIPEAEKSYVKAENLKPDEAAPHLGLARVYRSYSLYRHAYDEMKRAHDVAPGDVAVQLLWFNSLPMHDRVPAVEAFLVGPGAQYPQVTRALQQYLAFLKKNADAPVHACKVLSKVEETNTKLYAVPRPGTELGASGLVVKVNKEDMRLALDTGASGILLGRAAAEKAGVQRLAYQPIVGMGDSGQQGGYTAVADRIRIGDLEFQDCVVRVTEAATPVTGQDGLVGADVFSAYLIDIDIPGAKLRLSPLPKRPDEAAAPAALKTATQDNPEFDSDSQSGESSTASEKAASQQAANLPKDAYVAPDMTGWTKVYRFRNVLLVPTRVDGTGPLLFMIDTGSFSNILSTQAAHEVTQIRSDPNMQIKGLSGSVSKVYRADKAALQFGRYEQQNQDIVTFDLAAVSKQTGTEVSGILGFAMLRILQIKIDYRDGLVDFLYDPKHLPKQVHLNK